MSLSGFRLSLIGLIWFCSGMIPTRADAAANRQKQPMKKKLKKNAHDLEYSLNHGLFKETSRLSWEDFRERFELEYAAGLRTKSRKKQQFVFDVFEQICHPNKLADVNERMLSRFVTGMRTRKTKKGTVGLAPWTMRNYLVALRTAIAWAVGQKYLPACQNSLPSWFPRRNPGP